MGPVPRRLRRLRKWNPMGKPRTGKKIGNYLICEQIGGGAMGRVWRGIDEALGRPVAIKMLRSELADHPDLIERFRVEAQALARLNHPHIASVFALIEEGDERYLVMEYIQGETLHDRLARGGALPFDEAFPLFHQALDGVQHAHDAGVVHRDIKTSNLMLGPGGEAKWIDFGIARLDGRDGTTRTGGLMGTPEYMAPEQVHGESGTIQSDTYSLGVLLYKLLTGKTPFSGKGEFDVMRAHVETEPPRPSELGVDVGDALEAVLLRALDKDPAARFQSARAFQDALVKAGAPKPSHVTPAPVPESEPTLYDASAPPPAPTRPALGGDSSGDDEIAATVPGLDLAEISQRVDQEAPTRIDVEARRGRSRAVRWIAAVIFATGAALALDWIAASDRADRAPAPTASEAAPAVTQAGDQPDAQAVPPPDEATADAEAGAEPSPAAREAPRAPGWEILR